MNPESRAPHIKKPCLTCCLPTLTPNPSQHAKDPSPKMFSHPSLWAPLVAQMAKNLSAMQVQSLGRQDPLEKGMETHSSILPGESHGQRSLAGCRLGRQRVKQDWTTNTFTLHIPPCMQTERMYWSAGRTHQEVYQKRRISHLSATYWIRTSLQMQYSRWFICTFKDEKALLQNSPETPSWVFSSLSLNKIAMTCSNTIVTVPINGTQILHHWATWEVPGLYFLTGVSSLTVA